MHETIPTLCGDRRPSACVANLAGDGCDTRQSGRQCGSPPTTSGFVYSSAGGRGVQLIGLRPVELSCPSGVPSWAIIAAPGQALAALDARYKYRSCSCHRYCWDLPKVLDTSNNNDTFDLLPRYFWKSGDEIEQAQYALQRANLIFTVKVNVNGPIVEIINTVFRDHCGTNRIDYVAPACPVSGPVTPNTVAWILTGPRGWANGRTWVEDPKSLTQFTLTLQAIRSILFSYTPNNLWEGPFIFIVNHIVRSPATPEPVRVSNGPWVSRITSVQTQQQPCPDVEREPITALNSA
ncbi:hypothetical protein C8R45DRAFT_926945 [Mycena sanguinolenta]|nr:hypothetical protein C8R45DRAFT_926945 [Mycena sanguinolenta]